MTQESRRNELWSNVNACNPRQKETACLIIEISYSCTIIAGKVGEIPMFQFTRMMNPQRGYLIGIKKSTLILIGSYSSRLKVTKI